MHWRQKYRQAQQELLELRETLANAEARSQHLEQQNQQLQQQVGELQRRIAEPPVGALPLNDALLGDAPPGLQYGANLIALSVNLGREIGLRPARRAMKIFSAG